MQPARLRARTSNALREAVIDTGRLILFAVMLSIAFVASIILTAVAYGTVFDTGGYSAVQIFNSFTDSELSFYLLSLNSALVMGAVAYWTHQKIVAGLRQLRR
ncbi:hypothetical protein [Halostagnicola kamekurae]|uniref:Uncharacterized protein n=1 Tax=Halostagnicola kamekurae TaxID=619731 RepID=A0A1I6V8D4_9EURY|nr:hypothetical protein [Halostagnicola kamekurae]SFT09910.1 hypothetical protein SAMN04488556_0120 [Halostagnicola kamekurae]